jgi:ornithine cyclodeaminase
MTQIDVMDTAREAVEKADIVCATTASRMPVVMGKWISDGAHINAVGSCSPKWRELDTSAVTMSRLFVDWREATLKEAGDFLIPKEEGAIDDRHIVGEVGEILVGKLEGRTGDKETTIFKSVGIAAQDAVASHHVYQKAREIRVGTEIDFGGVR